MNRFLGNLINRHHHPSDQMAAAVVEPRPKSRFESGTVNAFEPNGIDADGISPTKLSSGLTEPEIGVQQENTEHKPIQVNVKQPISVPESLERGPVEQQKNRLNFNKVDHLNARIEAFSLQLGNRLSLAEPKTDRQINRQPHESESSQRLSNNKTQVDPNNLDMTYSLSQHVESVIKRLANQKTEANNEQAKNGQQSASLVTDLTPDFTQQRQSIQVTSDVAESASKSGILNNAGHPKQQTEPQTGLLQQPSWLSEMQSDLNQHWQDINAQLKPSDPVVNVTIGRVEVRAVKSETPKKSNHKKKPNGVMSLDDYLKERS